MKLMDAVKARRRLYRSRRRSEQAATTRAAILEAARRLFPQHGYRGTTMESIADAAGVATITVYSIFGSKRALLARLVDIAVGGDEEAVPVLEREAPQRVLRVPDQREQVRLFAEDIAGRMERVAPLLEVLGHAAPTEPEIAELLDHLLRQRLAGMQAFTSALRRNRPLRDGMSAQRAGETVWALTSAEVFLLMTRRLGWSRDRYVRWLDRSLRALLLVPTREDS